MMRDYDWPAAPTMLWSPRFEVKDRRMRLHSLTCWRGAAYALVTILTTLAPAAAHAQATTPSSPPPAASTPPGSAAATADRWQYPGFGIPAVGRKGRIFP